MKVKTLTVHWHEKEPVFSADWKGDRLATGGNDNCTRIWRLEKHGDTQLPVLTYVASLTKHTRPVNCVRWSPTENVLATAGDDGNILLWRRSDHAPKQWTGTFEVAPDFGDLERWIAFSSLSGSMSDVYDLAWSVDGSYLMSACIDKTVRIFSVKELKCAQVLSDHSHFVQGVCWDPLGQFLATQSCDRSLLIYEYVKSNGTLNLRNFARQSRSDFLPVSCRQNGVPATPNLDAISHDSKLHGTTSKSFKMFHDESLTSFFRRLTFSPDGSLLLAPAGVIKEKESADTVNCVAPVACFMGFKKPCIAIRFSPIRYQISSDKYNKEPPYITLPYCMVFAILTVDALFIYSTAARLPIAMLSGLHYAPHTDVAWSSDGKTIILTSADGFCSMATFDDGELGSVLDAGEHVSNPQTTTTFSSNTDGALVENKENVNEMDAPADSNHLVSPEKRPADSVTSPPDVGQSSAQQKRRIAPTFLSPIQ